MFKLIKALGRVVVKMYNVEARKLNAKAKAEAQLAEKLAKKARKLTESSIANTDSAAHVAAQAVQISKFF